MGDTPPVSNNSLEEREIRNLSQPPRRRFWRFALGLIGLVVLAVGGYMAYQLYQLDQGRKAVDALAKRMNREAEEFTRREMADTYGGKTPQETLEMYIAAVEKGDYELASKYFVIGEKEKELKSFSGVSPEKLLEYVSLLREALKSDGKYDTQHKYFSVEKPVSVRFILYPNGIWKLEGI